MGSYEDKIGWHQSSLQIKGWENNDVTNSLTLMGGGGVARNFVFWCEELKALWPLLLCGTICPLAIITAPPHANPSPPVPGTPKPYSISA